MNVKAHILLVEDDENLGFVTKDNLEITGFNVTWAKDGEAGFEAFCKGDFDLCILDVMLPKKDGFQLGKEIKAVNESTPIIFLTAKSLDPDKVQGFKIGADDYITKPFNMELLTLRIKALLKRYFSGETNNNDEKDVFIIGKYSFHFNIFWLLNGVDYTEPYLKKLHIVAFLVLYPVYEYK